MTFLSGKRKIDARLENILLIAVLSDGIFANQ
jgi:hypothetical protein